MVCIGNESSFFNIGPTNLAFDRIKSIKVLNSKQYIETNEDYLNDYFYDFVGVINSTNEIENIVLRVNKKDGNIWTQNTSFLQSSFNP